MNINKLNFQNKTILIVGDVILDPFLGSGTTAVAAKMSGRNYIGCDLSADYCKIAEERLAKTKSWIIPEIKQE